MHKVEFYQTQSLGWKWKLLYNGNVLARSECQYGSRSAAKKSFIGVAKGILKIKIS